MLDYSYGGHRKLEEKGFCMTIKQNAEKIAIKLIDALSFSRTNIVIIDSFSYRKIPEPGKKNNRKI